MNNKNEKTFADLFINSVDEQDDEVKDNNIALDILSETSENKNADVSSVSFNNFFNKINTSDKSVINDKENVDDNNLVIKNSFGDMVSATEEKVDEELENKEENNQTAVVEENVFGFGDAVNSIEEQVEDSLETEAENNETVVAEENVFGFGDVVNNIEEKVEDSLETEAENNETAVVEDNVFGLGEVSNSSSVSNNHIDIVKDNEEMGDNFVIENPLFSDKISLEEVDNTKKTTNKIDLTNTKHFNVKVVQKKDPLIKFIFGVISYAFFIWLLLIGITLLVYVLDIKIRASKGDYSSPLFNAYVVLTGSMLPEIQVNDVVITKRVEAKYLDVGDIITFASTDSRFAGTIITHRIIKKNPGVNGEGITFQTKGDNNNVADSALVTEANIYGKVILKIPKLGYLQEFLATDGGWIIVIVIPCLTVISYDIVKILKGLKKKKYKNINVKK